MNGQIVRWWLLDCPTTGKQAPSGYMGTEHALANVKSEGDLECPICGQLHPFTRDLLSLGEPVEF